MIYRSRLMYRDTMDLLSPDVAVCEYVEFTTLLIEVIFESSVNDCLLYLLLNSQSSEEVRDPLMILDACDQ